MTTLKTRIFDNVSSSLGVGSVHNMMILGEEAPVCGRIDVIVRGMKRLFVVAVQETDGVGDVTIVEVDAHDEETPVQRNDGVASLIAEAVGHSMVGTEVGEEDPTKGVVGDIA